MTKVLSKAFLQKMKELLVAEKQSLLTHTTREVDIDTDGDETDEIQGNILIEIDNQLQIRNSAKLGQIEEALLHIHEGKYGLCQDCEETIPEKRLLVNPYFQTCVSCAEEREADEKQRKRP
jgi:RNA polymerase-binding transcription factor DksA